MRGGSRLTPHCRWTFTSLRACLRVGRLRSGLNACAGLLAEAVLFACASGHAAHGPLRNCFGLESFGADILARCDQDERLPHSCCFASCESTLTPQSVEPTCWRRNPLMPTSWRKVTRVVTSARGSATGRPLGTAGRFAVHSSSGTAVARRPIRALAERRTRAGSEANASQSPCMLAVVCQRLQARGGNGHGLTRAVSSEPTPGWCPGSPL